jgi:hypothetical protein
MARIKCIQSFFELFWSRLLLTKRYRSGPITRLSGSVEFVITRTLVIYPVMLRNCSRMQRVSDRSNSPWYLFALMLDEDFTMKKKERINPRNTPMKINADIASI